VYNSRDLRIPHYKKNSPELLMPT
jgi:chromosome segregation ATPase